MNRIRFVKVRDVESPKRSNSSDAGLDFYIPRDITRDELKEVNKKSGQFKAIRFYGIKMGSKQIVDFIQLAPHSRVLIPSGIKVLIEPNNSALIAANKSGVSTNKGLIFTAEVVDSTYTGEMHLGILNTTDKLVNIDFGTKIIQFIHTPVYLTQPEEITLEEYNKEAEGWSDRGSRGFGSYDKE
jgi:dUTPase